jgi:F0F1-type ATP synthase membrane subunit c/vacuolar-type H+-ATPase subunit K
MENLVQSPALVMRVIKIAFIVSGFLYFYVAMKFTSQAQQPVTSAVQLAITIVAFTCVIFGFSTRSLFARPAESSAEKMPASTERGRWMTTSIISLAFFEACILFGFVLHVLGAPLWRVELLFGAGIASMLLWSPGKPPGAESGEFPPN